LARYDGQGAKFKPDTILYQKKLFSGWLISRHENTAEVESWLVHTVLT